MQRLPTQAELALWDAAYQARQINIGIVTGTSPRNHAVFDGDDDDFVYWLWTSPVAQRLLQRTWVVQTGSGNGHVHLLSQTPVGSAVIVRCGKRLGELKAAGGYVCAPPSIHDTTGQPYRTVYGSPDKILLAIDAKAVFDALADAYASELQARGAAAAEVQESAVPQEIRPLGTPADQIRLRQQMRATGVTPKVMRAVRDGVIPQEGDWSHCPSHSEIDYAVIGDLIDSGWSDEDIHQIYASFPIGTPTYRNTDRPNHGWRYLFGNITSLRAKAAQRKHAESGARGENFTVLEVLREEWPDDPIYKVRIRAPEDQKEGWVKLNSMELYSARLFGTRCLNNLGVVVRLRPEHAGKNYLRFAGLIAQMARSVPIPQAATNIGLLAQKIASIMNQGMYQGVPNIRDDWTLGWRDEQSGFVFVHGPTLYARLSAAVRPTPQAKAMYEAIAQLGGENTVIRYGHNNSFAARVYRVPLEEVLAAADGASQ